MISWLKYLPIHLRHGDNSAECRGPSFSHAKPIHLLANGCNIRMVAPKHRSTLPDPPLYLENREGIKQHFKPYDSHMYANSNWARADLVARRWSYWTAWFAGSHSEMYMLAQLLKRSEGKDFSGTSFFHPRSFEFAIANYLNFEFGHREIGGQPVYKGPVKWTVHQQLPVSSASFLIEKADGPQMFYCFPISDDCLFSLRFRFRTIDESVRKDMETLATSVISSTSMDLSQEAKTQIEKVKAECPDMSLTADFAPLKWPIAKEDVEALSNLGREASTMKALE